jgi:hypothetical protein
LYATKRVTLSGGPTAPRLANQILMHLVTYGSPQPWSKVAREIEAQMGAAPHTVHMVVATYPGIVLDLEHDVIDLKDPAAFRERVLRDLK